MMIEHFSFENVLLYVFITGPGGSTESDLIVPMRMIPYWISLLTENIL